MAGFTARLLLRRIAGADRNPSARVPVKPMNGPAPSIAQDFVHKGFSFPLNQDESPQPIIPIRASRAVSEGRSRSSHSQTTITDQPNSLSCRCWR